MRRSLPDPSLSLAELLPSWQLALQAERKSPGTIKSYTEGVTFFLRWCAGTGTPPQLDRSAVQAFGADLLERGAEPTTARARQLGVRRFARWLVDEGELD